MLPVKNIEEYNGKNILSLDDASLLIKKMKESGKKIGLCHGGFDLLHPGQVKHLESAREICDLLFVSVTSDKFVGERKGSGRPVFSDKLRAYMLSNLKAVDYVIISDYKSGVDVINMIKPSFYIKGPDFIKKNTPGITAERRAISNSGGEMKYTTDSKLSTTEIIKYIKEEVDTRKILLCIDRDGTLIEEENFLGADNNWKEKIRLKKNTIDLISFLQTKYNTKKIVISNQAGVARGYFNCQRVEDINNHIDELLKKEGIKIENWQYCPDVDSDYAESKRGEIKFIPEFVKKTTKRKPSDAMVLDGLMELGKRQEDFSEIVVFGDREEDRGLAKKLNALYVDSKEEYESSVRKIEGLINQEDSLK